MRFKVLIGIILTVFLANCNTGPDFKRDSVFDKGADVPNAIFINPTGEENSRGEYEFNSFTIKLNSASLNKDVRLALISDKDGEFFTTDELTMDTLRINQTKLSKNKHAVSLVLDSKKTDQVNVNVNLASDIILYGVEKESLGYKLKWSKYQGTDFERYEIHVRLKNGTSEIIKEVSNIEDTVFVNYRFPIEEELKYYITSHSKEHLAANKSGFISINPIIFNSPIYIVDKIIGFKNESFIAFMTLENESFYINSYNIFRNELVKKNFPDNRLRKLFAIKHSENSKLFASMNTELLEFNPLDLSIISRHNPSSKAFAGQEFSNKPVSDIIYDNQTKTYFIIFGTSYPHGPYSFDNNFNYINNYKVERIHTFLGINNNTLFVKNDWSRNTIYSYSFDGSGVIREITNNPSKFPVTSSISAVSEKNNKLILGNGYVFSADLKLKFLTLLPEIDGYYTSYAIKESNQDTLFASSSKGVLYKIFIPDNEIISAQDFKYTITNIFLINDHVYLLQKNNNYSNPGYKLTYVP